MAINECSTKPRCAPVPSVRGNTPRLFGSTLMGPPISWFGVTGVCKRSFPSGEGPIARKRIGTCALLRRDWAADNGLVRIETRDGPQGGFRPCPRRGDHPGVAGIEIRVANRAQDRSDTIRADPRLRRTAAGARRCAQRMRLHGFAGETRASERKAAFSGLQGNCVLTQAGRTIRKGKIYNCSKVMTRPRSAGKGDVPLEG